MYFQKTDYICFKKIFLHIYNNKCTSIELHITYDIYNVRNIFKFFIIKKLYIAYIILYDISYYLNFQ